MAKYTFKSQFATEFEFISAKNGHPTILYLHGFCSDCWGRKPETVKKFCIQSGCGFLRFEYAGHGADKENFEKADFAVWKNQVLELIDDVIVGDVICVGSSLGGWLALLAAAERPTRVAAVVGLAAAPNFITRFAGKMSDAQKQELQQTGKTHFGGSDFVYTVTARFVQTAMENLLDENAPWPINCKLRLLQGTEDKYVDWRLAPAIADKVTGSDCVVHLIKGADHRLNDDVSIRLLQATLGELTSGDLL